VPLSFKDGEYYSNEYTIQSRPEKGTAPYTIEKVTALPNDTVSEWTNDIEENKIVEENNVIDEIDLSK